MGIKQSSNPKRMGRKPKFDYRGEEFLSRIAELAGKGCTDREIAHILGLNESTFSEKKAEFSEIAETLTRARAQVNSIVRAAFLKSALGGRMLKTYRYIQKRCECKGQNPDCEICDGTGWITPEQHRELIETEQPPNPLIQERWLRVYDPDYSKSMKDGETSNGEGNNIEGIDINVSYNQKEDLELQQRVKKQDETTT